MAKKSDENDDKADLLVFGYACKLFRDDERALQIDNEQHLIPWMDNETIRIDRYDGRGALYDLGAHEAVPGAWEELGTEEQAMEAMCDQERYRSLYMNEVEEQTYKEELAKRLQQQSQEYGQVAYDYGSTTPTVSLPTGEEQEDSVPSKPYVPPPELNVPPDLKLPETMKHSAIIERTALFIAQQGSQMEILMKLKQQGNKNFDFLSHNDPLYDFYKHVLSLIKSGSYVPTTQEHIFEEVAPQPTQPKNFEVGEEELGDHYLHPSLVPRPIESREVPPPPSIAPSPDKTKAPVSGPPELVKNVIRRMVNYVIRNGPAFERAIMRKKDVRFDFIKPSHQYNIFYRRTLVEEQKIYNEQILKKQKEKEKAKTQEKIAPIPQETITASDSPSSAPEDSNDGTKILRKRPLPVNFSIKKPKENKSLEVPSALPVEESSDEDDSNNSGITSPKQGGSNKQGSETSQEPSEDVDYVNPLSKRLKKSNETSTSSKSNNQKDVKKHSSANKKDSALQSERKLKVAQFLKDLKKKTL